MRFRYAKNDKGFCWYCKCNFERGDSCLDIFAYRMLTFHVNCYREWNDNRIVTEYIDWRLKTDTPKKIGRPKISTKELYKWKPRAGRPAKYKDSLQAQRIHQLLSYHRRKGNYDRVETLLGELDRLRVDGPIGCNTPAASPL